MVDSLRLMPVNVMAYAFATIYIVFLSRMQEASIALHFSSGSWAYVSHLHHRCHLLHRYSVNLACPVLVPRSARFEMQQHWTDSGEFVLIVKRWICVFGFEWSEFRCLETLIRVPFQPCKVRDLGPRKHFRRKPEGSRMEPGGEWAVVSR